MKTMSLSRLYMSVDLIRGSDILAGSHPCFVYHIEKLLTSLADLIEKLLTSFMADPKKVKWWTSAKGQLISKCLFDSIVSTKKPTNFF